MNSPQSKKRDAEATRERILQAATHAFAAKGYDGVGIREIAAAADVNVALVGRYFGSKRNLFVVSTLPQFKVDQLLDIDMSEFSELVSRDYAGKHLKDKGVNDPMLALLRSVGSPEVGDDVRDALSRQIIQPLADKLGGAHAEQRAAMIVAQLAGFDLFRRIVGVHMMSPAHSEELSALLKTALDGMIRPDRPE